MKIVGEVPVCVCALSVQRGTNKDEERRGSPWVGGRGQVKNAFAAVRRSDVIFVGSHKNLFPSPTAISVR